MAVKKYDIEEKKQAYAATVYIKNSEKKNGSASGNDRENHR